MVVLEKTFESPLDCKEFKPVNPKGNQSWIFIGNAEAEAPILWPPDVKSRLIEKDPDAGKDWRQEEKGTTEDEMVGWHHRLNGHESEQTPGDSEWQGAWCAAVHGVPKSGHDLATKQQLWGYGITGNCFCNMFSISSIIQMIQWNGRDFVASSAYPWFTLAPIKSQHWTHKYPSLIPNSTAVFLYYFWDIFEIIYILHVPLTLPWQLGGWLEEIRVILNHWNKWK